MGVDFDFDEDQQAFRESVATVLSRQFDRDRIHALLDDERGFSDDFWALAADLGWTALLVPEEHGGLGQGLVDAVVLMEEAGRLPLPGPLFSSAVLATVAARRLGADDLLPGLADGSRRGTVAITEGSATDPLTDIRTTAEPDGDGWRLHGLKTFVLDGHTADWIVVAATTPEGLGAFLIEDHGATHVPGLDPTRKVAQLALDGTRARRLGPADATDVLQRIVDDAAVGLCAELVGGMERTLDLAVRYSNDRVQFGRPIGAFQAIRHMAAEMLQKLELARVGTHYAAWTSDGDADDRVQSVALAKSWAAEAAVAVTGESIQIHGAVGFTWQSDPHLFYKRAKVNDLLLGPQGWQRQRVADAVIGPVGAGA
jgi:alkylation response protein AidB-like acyl-CoA dehydrogenase